MGKEDGRESTRQDKPHLVLNGHRPHTDEPITDRPRMKQTRENRGNADVNKRWEGNAKQEEEITKLR